MTSLRLKDEDFSDGLYNIAKVIDYLRGGGNDYGCGVDHSNEVFTMYGFWAHSECDVCGNRGYDAEYKALVECGVNREEWDAQWKRHYARDDIGSWDQMPKYPDNYREAYDRILLELEEKEPHECTYAEWHFEHPSSGLKVKWYKRIGRSTKSNTDLTMTQWYTIVLECLESLREEASDG